MKIKRSILALFLVLCLALSLGATALAANEAREIEIVYRGIALEADGAKVTPCDETGKAVEPFILNGSVYLPVRAVAGALGLGVKWSDADSAITLTSGAEKRTGSGSPAASSAAKTVAAGYRGIKLVLDGTTVTPMDVNGRVVEPFIIDGTTYLPVRAIASALDALVEWDDAASTVKIASAEAPASEAYAANAVQCYINGDSIRSFDIAGKTYIPAGDLVYYGFSFEDGNVEWAGTDYRFNADSPAILSNGASGFAIETSAKVGGEAVEAYAVADLICIPAAALDAFGYSEAAGGALNIYVAAAGYGESENDYRTLTVDASGTGESVKTLLGSHWDPGTPGSDRSSAYIELGISSVRTHQSGSWEPEYTDPETGKNSNEALSLISPENKGRGDIYGIFKDPSADPNDWDSYDFASTDKLIDNILAIGAHVTFRFSGIQEMCPEDPDEFAAFCEKYAAVAAHIADHYNNGANGSGYNDVITFFEIWNEPDIHGGWAGRDAAGVTSGTAEQFCDFYGAVTAAANETAPDMIVGGYAFTTHHDTYGYGESLINAIVEKGYVMERFSFHYYPSVHKDPLSYATFAEEYTAMFNAAAEKYGRPEYADMPMSITEWDYLETTGFNMLTPEQRPGEMMAAYLVNALTYMQDSALVDAIMWMPTYNDARLFDNDYNITYKGRAFEAMNALTGCERLSASGGDKNGFSILAGRNEDEVNVIISNYVVSEDEMTPYSIISNFHPMVSPDGKFTVPNVADWRMSTPRQMTYARNGGYDLVISDIPFDCEEVTLTQYRIDAGNAYEAIASETLRVENGSVSFSSELAPNSVDLLRITPVS